jgi:hypothetical protein
MVAASAVLSGDIGSSSGFLLIGPNAKQFFRKGQRCPWRLFVSGCGNSQVSPPLMLPLRPVVPGRHLRENRLSFLN